MTNVLKQFFGSALDAIIENVANNLIEEEKRRQKLIEEENRRQKLKNGSIDVDFKVKETKQIIKGDK